MWRGIAQRLLKKKKEVLEEGEREGRAAEMEFRN